MFPCRENEKLPRATEKLTDGNPDQRLNSDNNHRSIYWAIGTDVGFAGANQ
jgi:hypothetical protein